MTLSRAKRFLLALLTQAMLCLTFAPVIAAAQADCARAAKDDDRPNRGGATILAARDAANVRPEEMSDAERRASARRGAGERGSSHRHGHGIAANAIDEWVTVSGNAQHAHPSFDGSSAAALIDDLGSQALDLRLLLTRPAFDSARGLFSALSVQLSHLSFSIPGYESETVMRSLTK